MKNREDIEKWYDNNKNTYKSLAETIGKLIEKIVKVEKIPYNSISYRRKDKKSYCDKAMKDKYIDPANEIQDFAGIRVIAYVNSDVKKICDIIEREFDIDIDNSENKTESLGANEVGYMSVHYIAKLKKERESLPEYGSFKGLCFEIQVRTLLQHAWAEIEHDRNYKFGGVLKKSMQRKFYLIAGMLEIADTQFDDISNEIDIYTEEVAISTKEGKLEDILIDSTSLSEYLSQRYEEEIKSNKIVPRFGSNDRDSVVTIAELEKFGIKNLSQLDSMLSREFDLNPIEYSYRNMIEYSFLGLLIDYMMLTDIEKYFRECWNNTWGGITEADVKMFEGNGIDMSKIIAEYSLDVF